MLQIIGKWGNNLAVRIPKEISTFTQGETVDVVQTGDSLLIAPLKKKRSMAELLSKEKGVHEGELADFGKAVGGEYEL
jgi:antitoxin component of MazEF toxin-antitoxin module